MARNSCKLTVCLAALLLLPFGGRADDGLIGTKASEWHVTHWMHSKPLKLSDLKGKVVLVRWWTAPGCPFCRATAPALNEFHKRFADKGLVVIGFYHHKSRAPLDAAEVKRQADKLGFRFPLAIDVGWKTLKAWWLSTGDRGWTSVTFLIDRKGVIRFIHPGGQYVRGDRAYTEIKRKIEELLAEK
jgi:thiol-disulfide isomerase/thioredoxin